MARIRSIHPGLFTDEVFMAASPHARIFMVGLWTEADDQGIFEWKPLTLKARLLPVDAVDAASLLSELETAGAVRRFEADGKAYGAVRNFRKFQRPQKPTAQHPLPEAMRSFVGLSETPTVAVEEPSNTPTVNPPQMEDGGKEEEEREEESGGEESARSARDDLDDWFERVWQALPKRDGANPKGPARNRFRAKCKVAEPADILRGAELTRRRCDERGETGTRFAPQAVTWLNQERWKDELEAPADDGKRSSSQRNGRNPGDDLNRAFDRLDDRIAGRAPAGGGFGPGAHAGPHRAPDVVDLDPGGPVGHRGH